MHNFRVKPAPTFKPNELNNNIIHSLAGEWAGVRFQNPELDIHRKDKSRPIMTSAKSKNQKSKLKSQNSLLREHAEQQFAEELEELAKVDKRQRPPNWKLSPWAVTTYLLGGKLENGFEVTPKYIGDRRIIEIAVATLTTDRALLLLGVPGTAKSWVSEHLSAGVSGDSTLLIQGTAGTSEESIRYGWNYARLLAEGPSMDALVASPLMRAMEDGKIARVEELTRIPADVQDTLITILSEKTLPIPELGEEVQAIKGFSVIATANDRDKGINDLSSALKRRFNTVVLPLPKTIDEEVEIVQRRVESLGRALELPAEPPALEEVRRVVTIFRELRSGITEDGKTKIKSPSSTLSTAEAISVVNSGLALAAHFGDGRLGTKDIASGLIGAVVKDPVQDQIVWKEYLETVVKERSHWKDLYRACREVGG
jgi:MoxR-like ATPase